MKKLIVILALVAVLAVPAAVSAAGSVSVDIEAPCAGWHMLSVPVVPDNPAATAVFNGALAVYVWDPVAKTFLYNPTIDPCKGYWVAVDGPTTFTVTGEPYSG